MDLTTGYPFWLIKNGLPHTYPKLGRDLRTDIAVIGGGISGALSAWHLAKAGIKCTVVDGRSIGLGSTCASTALLQYELDEPLSLLTGKIGRKSAERAYSLCAGAVDRILSISRELGFADAEKNPSLFFAATAKDAALIENEFSARKKAGHKVELLNTKDIRRHYGFDAPAAILSAKGASVDSYMLTHALLQSAMKKGAEVYDRTPVAAISYGKRDVELRTEAGHVIRAKNLVNATGYEVLDFVSKKIVKLYSTYAIASEHGEDIRRLWKDNAMIWNTADPYLYMRRTKDERIIVGGRDQAFYNPSRRDKLVKRKSRLLEKDFLGLFPGVEFKKEFSWAGTFGATKDSLPYIGIYPGKPHTFFALGFGGNGITFSLIAAEIITDLAQGRKNPDAELFSFGR